VLRHSMLALRDLVRIRLRGRGTRKRYSDVIADLEKEEKSFRSANGPTA
jgi:hypothetical protein